MTWTQKELEAFYQTVDGRVKEDPAFREAFQKDAGAAMEKLAGKKLPDDFMLQLIETDGNYSVAYVVPGFTQKELDMDALMDEDIKDISGRGDVISATSVAVVVLT